MQKPNNFDNVAASLAYEPLKLGGHPCIIKGVEETKTKTTGKDMLKVALDIADGDEQAGYYQAKYDVDARDNRKWPCVSYIVTEDKDGNCSRNLAGFVTSIEESNSGFKFPWDKTSLLKGKKVGCVFGQEEYMNDKGEIKKSTKPFYFCSVERAKTAAVPKLKEYKAARTPANPTAWNDITADDIPF